MKNIDPSSMSLEQKVGQMIMVDFPGQYIEGEVKKHLESRPWGGVILFAQNIKSDSQLAGLNGKIMEINQDIPPFISVDQEGGLVCRVDFSCMHLSPGNMALGRIGDEYLAERMAAVCGAELRELGFHLDFAPCVDVNINPQNPIIGVRSFGENPEIVCRMGAATVRGFERAGLASCAKHFPGHGDTSFDSHLSLASVEADMSRIEKVELPPFKAAIDAGVPSIMTAHVVFPAIDNDERIPATLSKRVFTGLLRGQMGFDGLIITDSMSMKAIADHFGTEDSVIRAVNAGADIVMMCGTAESQLAAYDTLINAVRTGKISIDTINKAVERILGFKKKYVTGNSNGSEFTKDDRRRIAKEAAEKAVEVLYDDWHIFPINSSSKHALLISPDRVYQTMLGEKSDSWSIYPIIKDRFSSIEQRIYEVMNPSSRSLAEAVDGDYDTVLIEIYSRAAMPQNLKDAVESAINAAKSRNKKVILISLSSPYGIPDTADAAITGYNYSRVSLEAVADKMLLSNERCTVS